MKHFILPLVGIALLVCVSQANGQSIEVPSDGSIVTSPPLHTGQLYQLEASGTWTYGVNGSIADPEWFRDKTDWDLGWRENMEDPFVSDLADLLVDDEFQDWRGTQDGTTFAPHVFSPTHVYRLEWMGDGSPVQFRIKDHDWAYGDNSGFLTVQITPQIAPVPEASDFATWTTLGVLGFTLYALRKRM